MERVGKAEKRCLAGMMTAGLVVLLLAVPWAGAQSNGQNQSQTPANTQQSQDIPDAPSAVQPPVPKLQQPTSLAPSNPPQQDQAPEPGQSSSNDTVQEPDQDKTPPPPMPPVQTLPPGSVPQITEQQGTGQRNQLAAKEDVYKIPVVVNYVQIPVTVKDKYGRQVYGLLPKDFTVYENGKPQKLVYFTSDPFQLSVAIVLDLGMTDVTLQKVNQTFSALVGSLSPYDEFALYTYSSTVSQVTDFTNRPQLLTAQLNELKLVRGKNGVPVLGGPLASGPTVNGLPVGGPAAVPVNTPPIEARVLNDALLRAALDLSKRPRERRKVILIVSDGQERGSSAKYKQVLRVLQTYGIQVKSVVVGSSALPVYKQVEKVHHLFEQGYSNILPAYTSKTGGGTTYSELTRNAIEDAYASITSEARNGYTIGYNAPAVKGSSAYRTIEVVVDRKNLNIYTKAGYYPVPSMR